MCSSFVHYGNKFPPFTQSSHMYSFTSLFSRHKLCLCGGTSPPVPPSSSSTRLNKFSLAPPHHSFHLTIISFFSLRSVRCSSVVPIISGRRTSASWSFSSLHNGAHRTTMLLLGLRPRWPAYGRAGLRPGRFATWGLDKGVNWDSRLKGLFQGLWK